MASVTSSYRISEELASRLESTSARLKKGKNRIVTEALEEYLRKHDEEWFRKEAARQSRLVSATEWEDEELWDEAAAEAWDAK